MSDEQYTYCYHITGQTRKHEPSGFFASSRGTLHKVRYARLLGGRLDAEGFIWVTSGGIRTIESFRASNLVEYDYEIYTHRGPSHPLHGHIVED